jgi:hypothetical protein
MLWMINADALATLPNAGMPLPKPINQPSFSVPVSPESSNLWSVLTQKMF